MIALAILTVFYGGLWCCFHVGKKYEEATLSVPNELTTPSEMLKEGK